MELTFHWHGITIDGHQCERMDQPSIPVVDSHSGSSKILIKFDFYIKLHEKKSKTHLTEVNDHHSNTGKHSTSQILTIYQ